MQGITDEQAGRIMTLLRRVTHGFGNQLNALFTEELGLTLPQLIVLRVINEYKTFPTAAEVAEKVRLAPSTVSGIIKRLTRDGLLERHEDPNDLRVHRLAVTKRGQAAVADADAMYHAYAKARLSALTPSELAVFADLLEKVYRSVESAQDPSAEHD